MSINLVCVIRESTVVDPEPVGLTDDEPENKPQKSTWFVGLLESTFKFPNRHSSYQYAAQVSSLQPLCFERVPLAALSLLLCPKLYYFFHNLKVANWFDLNAAWSSHKCAHDVMNYKSQQSSSASTRQFLLPKLHLGFSQPTAGSSVSVPTCTNNISWADPQPCGAPSLIPFAARFSDAKPPELDFTYHSAIPCWITMCF